MPSFEYGGLAMESRLSGTTRNAAAPSGQPSTNALMNSSSDSADGCSGLCAHAASNLSRNSSVARLQSKYGPWRWPCRRAISPTISSAAVARSSGRARAAIIARRDGSRLQVSVAVRIGCFLAARGFSAIDRNELRLARGRAHGLALQKVATQPAQDPHLRLRLDPLGDDAGTQGVREIDETGEDTYGALGVIDLGD